MNVRKLVLIAVFTAIGVTLSILESILPLGYLGIRIGIANIATMMILYLYSYKEAFIVQLIRILLVGLIFSGITSASFFMSLTGGIFSLIGMFIVYKIDKNRIFLLSSVGALSHLIGQSIILSLYVRLDGWLLYIPFLGILSILSSIFTGLVTILSLKPLKIELEKRGFVDRIFQYTMILVLVIFEIIIYNKNYKSSYNEVVKVTTNGIVIFEVDLNKPDNYKSYNNSFTHYEKENDSYYYYFNIKNYDDNDTHELTIELIDKKVRVYDITCKNKLCIKEGYISKPYQKIVCLPNKMVISITSYSNSDIDYIL